MHSKDGDFQAADRLDPVVIGGCAADSGQNSGRCASQRWIAVIQRSELFANPWTMDAHVCHPQSELRAESVYAIHF